MRGAGVLLPLSSLPGPYGIGTLGRTACDFADFLKKAGQSYWQILPLGPTGYGDSPYQSFSAFASNPYFIDPDLLERDGLLTRQEIDAFDWGDDPNRVDYGLLYRSRRLLLQKAADRLAPQDSGLSAFAAENRDWLEDYALFMALKEENGQKPWTDWPDPVRLRQTAALEAARHRLAPRLHYWRTVQYLFCRQWEKLKNYANRQGIAVIGDLPIYVSPDSADVWASPELFQLNGDRRMTLVAGCPPDAFSADGQLWGNPLYDWDEHHSTGYAWWLRRLRHALEQCDVVRIDHFRGFESYYAIPAGETTAKNGSWHKGPDRDFIYTLHAALPNAPIIAEDLGFLTPEVKHLLTESGYPGMKVLQFAFDSRESGDYLPTGYPHHAVVYTGTHDNIPTAAWQTEADPADVQKARDWLHCPEGDLTEPLIRAALDSVCDTAIIPLQDWLGLGAEARMNTPSRPDGNWQWRAPAGFMTPALAKRICALTEETGRLHRRHHP